MITSISPRRQAVHVRTHNRVPIALSGARPTAFLAQRSTGATTRMPLFCSMGAGPADGQRRSPYVDISNCALAQRTCSCCWRQTCHWRLQVPRPFQACGLRAAKQTRLWGCSILRTTGVLEIIICESSNVAAAHEPAARQPCILHPFCARA